VWLKAELLHIKEEPFSSTDETGKIIDGCLGASVTRRR
jgi:hypothetical protein